MDVQELVKNYLEKAEAIQIASCNNAQPWVCSVWFVVDEGLNVYWMSWPSRRHSIEFKSNKKAAFTTAIKTDRPDIGVGAEGEVEEVSDLGVIEKIMPRYIKKYGSGKDFIGLYKEGKNQHVLYRFKPSKFVLVDEVNFQGQGSIDWLPK